MAKKPSMWKQVGNWAFIGGVILAVVIGLFSSQVGNLGPTLTTVLVILGLIVGLLNVQPDEALHFLAAAVSIVVVAEFGGAGFEQVQTVGPALSGLFMSLKTFVVPATVVVALAALFSVARD
ncbi:hypothetical protein GF342_00180 [Candidatus Woesearchaeota archaeon]|nr:hypothetical protein [Candidatus Woesearchaeota archaeon]